MIDLDAVRTALRRDTRFAGIARAQLRPLASHGVGHDHVRVDGAAIEGRPIVLRVPRLSQWRLPAAEALEYQAAGFARLSASGHAPRCFGTLPPSDELPRGALIVEFIDGAKPTLPRDMRRIAECLARIHLLPVPLAAQRAPLLSHDDAVEGTLRAIDEQMSYLPQLDLAPESRLLLRRAQEWARRLTPDGLPPPVTTLCGTDTHPGNYLIDARGRAVFVDGEKALFGNPAADIAHASNPPSTLWDADIGTVLEADAVRAFFDAYFDCVGAALAARVRPWLPIMRRLIALRTVTWGVRWRVLSGRGDGGMAEWSAERLPAGLRGHMERITQAWLEPKSLQMSLSPALD
ncbi:MAG: aminoglycoside phosphotransferase family protein [Alphaproteobacteria bacterium]